MRSIPEKIAIHNHASVGSPDFAGVPDERETPMTSLNDRERAFENKYAHDEGLKFKIVARRNKLLGQWAGALLGKADIEAYAKDVVVADFEEAGDEDVVRKVLADFAAGGISHTAEDIRTKMIELLAVATDQVDKG
eukprot:gene37579-50731_t